MSALHSLVYGMFFDYKRLSLFAISRKINIHYQKLQYFFSESSWDINKLNDVRLGILQNQSTTRDPTVSSPLMILPALSLMPKKPKALNFNTVVLWAVRKIAILPSLHALSPTPNTSLSILNPISLYKASRRRILKVNLIWPKNSSPKLSLKISPSPLLSLTLGTLPPR